MRRLRDNPLSAEDVHVIPGAAGGPKALGLNGLDKTLFGHWLPNAPQPRALVGSSIGSWRFAALLASASIPMVMSGVVNIPGAPAGLYRDGGLLDYHLDLPYQQPGVVLYPHFTDRIIPGWFDKPLPWRKSNASHVQDVLLVSPSADYLASLPNGKLPDRRDFEKYLGDDVGREKSWRRAIAESERLGDDFMELVEKRQWDSVMQPL